MIDKFLGMVGPVRKDRLKGVNDNETPIETSKSISAIGSFLSIFAAAFEKLTSSKEKQPFGNSCNKYKVSFLWTL